MIFVRAVGQDDDHGLHRAGCYALVHRSAKALGIGMRLRFAPVAMQKIENRKPPLGVARIGIGQIDRDWLIGRIAQQVVFKSRRVNFYIHNLRLCECH